MLEEIFVKKATRLMHKIRLDYEMANNIKGDAKALYLLCHNFLELEKMREKNKEGKQKYKG